MIEARVKMYRILSVSVLVVCIMVSLCGCEAFTRKFTRKPKKQDKPQENMVLAPEAYPDSRSNAEEAYRHYFTYWSSWHDELLDTFAEASPSMRKLLDTMQEALKNLSEMEARLTGAKQEEARKFLGEMHALKTDIAQDLYGNNAWSMRRQADSLKRQINRSLQYSEVKDYIK